jgi:hypothetical protein
MYSFEKFVIIQWITRVVPKLANLLMHSQCALSEPISSSRKTWKLTVCRFIWRIIHCIITNFACLSGNKFTNWCPSSRWVFKSIKVIFYCSWAVHLERNIYLEMHECHNFRHVFRGTIDFARVTHVSNRESFRHSIAFSDFAIFEQWKSKFNFWHVHTLRSVFVNSPPPKPEVILTNLFARRKLWHSYISKLFLTKMQVKFSIFFHRGSLNVIGDKFRFVRSKLKSR